MNILIVSMLPNAGESMRSRKREREAVLPEMMPGKYRLLYPLRLRKGAGLNYDCRRAKNQKADGTLPAGTIVRIDEIKYLSVSVWGKSEDGWLCLFMSHTPYVKWLGKNQ